MVSEDSFLAAVIRDEKKAQSGFEQVFNRGFTSMYRKLQHTEDKPVRDATRMVFSEGRILILNCAKALERDHFIGAELLGEILGWISYVAYIGASQQRLLLNTAEDFSSVARQLVSYLRLNPLFRSLTHLLDQFVALERDAMQPLPKRFLGLCINALR